MTNKTKTLTFKLDGTKEVNLVFKALETENRVVWNCAVEDETINDLEELLRIQK